MKDRVRSWLLLAIAFAMACATGATDARVEQTWKHHETVFAAALVGPSEEQEFLDACTFFEELTGIRLNLEIFTMGALPTSESKNDLERLRAWHRKNRELLYWDIVTNSVRIKADTQPVPP
jgi:hypothetical protein